MTSFFYEGWRGSGQKLSPADKSACKSCGQGGLPHKKKKVRQLLGATQRNPTLTEIFIYETLPALTNINSTLTRTSYIYSSPQDTGAAEGECGHHWKHRHWGRHGHHHLWKKLNLTDEQKKEVFSIRLEERAKMKPFVEKLKAGRDQLRALPKGQFDEAKVRAIAKGQADTIADLIVAREHMKSRIYAVLTPEQRANVEQMREKWQSRHDKEPKHKD